jgi:hypothetical protein
MCAPRLEVSITVQAGGSGTMRKGAIRLASLGVSAGLLLLALHGTAAATPPVRAPEIDPNMAAGSLALLSTAGLLLLERLRRR